MELILRAHLALELEEQEDKNMKKAIAELQTAFKPNYETMAPPMLDLHLDLYPKKLGSSSHPRAIFLRYKKDFSSKGPSSVLLLPGEFLKNHLIDYEHLLLGDQITFLVFLRLYENEADLSSLWDKLVTKQGRLPAYILSFEKAFEEELKAFCSTVFTKPPEEEEEGSNRMKAQNTLKPVLLPGQEACLKTTVFTDDEWLQHLSSLPSLPSTASNWDIDYDRYSFLKRLLKVAPEKLSDFHLQSEPIVEAALLDSNTIDSNNIDSSIDSRPFIEAKATVLFATVSLSNPDLKKEYVNSLNNLKYLEKSSKLHLARHLSAVKSYFSIAVEMENAIRPALPALLQRYYLERLRHHGLSDLERIEAFENLLSNELATIPIAYTLDWLFPVALPIRRTDWASTLKDPSFSDLLTSLDGRLLDLQSQDSPVAKIEKDNLLLLRNFVAYLLADNMDTAGVIPPLEVAKSSKLLFGDRPKPGELPEGITAKAPIRNKHLYLPAMKRAHVIAAPLTPSGPLAPLASLALLKVVGESTGMNVAEKQPVWESFFKVDHTKEEYQEAFRLLEPVHYSALAVIPSDATYWPRIADSSMGTQRTLELQDGLQRHLLSLIVRKINEENGTVTSLLAAFVSFASFPETDRPFYQEQLLMAADLLVKKSKVEGCTASQEGKTSLTLLFQRIFELRACFLNEALCESIGVTLFSFLDDHPPKKDAEYYASAFLANISQAEGADLWHFAKQNLNRPLFLTRLISLLPEAQIGSLAQQLQPQLTPQELLQYYATSGWSQQEPARLNALCKVLLPSTDFDHAIFLCILEGLIPPAKTDDKEGPKLANCIQAYITVAQQIFRSELGAFKDQHERNDWLQKEDPVAALRKHLANKNIVNQPNLLSLSVLLLSPTGLGLPPDMDEYRRKALLTLSKPSPSKPFLAASHVEELSAFGKGTLSTHPSDPRQSNLRDAMAALLPAKQAFEFHRFEIDSGLFRLGLFTLNSLGYETVAAFLEKHKDKAMAEKPRPRDASFLKALLRLFEPLPPAEDAETRHADETKDADEAEAQSIIKKGSNDDIKQQLIHAPSIHLRTINEDAKKLVYTVPSIYIEATLNSWITPDDLRTYKPPALFFALYDKAQVARFPPELCKLLKADKYVEMLYATGTIASLKEECRQQAGSRAEKLFKKNKEENEAIAKRKEDLKKEAQQRKAEEAAAQKKEQKEAEAEANKKKADAKVDQKPEEEENKPVESVKERTKQMNAEKEAAAAAAKKALAENN